MLSTAIIINKHQTLPRGHAVLCFKDIVKVMSVPVVTNMAVDCQPDIGLECITISEGDTGGCEERIDKDRNAKPCADNHVPPLGGNERIGGGELLLVMRCPLEAVVAIVSVQYHLIKSFIQLEGNDDCKGSYPEGGVRQYEFLVGKLLPLCRGWRW